MTDPKTPPGEGSLDAPTRHPIDWQSPEYTDEGALFAELTRVFEICHGCRRCFSLCNAFPTLFDAVDESPTMELDSVPREAYWKVVDHCYLCDMCYMTKCPYVPPHEWNVDFPHLMLRAKAKRFGDEKASVRDRVLSSTDTVGKLAGIPVVAEAVNAVNASKLGRRVLESAFGVDAKAPVPKYHSRTARRRLKDRVGRKGDGARESLEAEPAGATKGKVVVFATCYGNRNEPSLVEDLVAVLEHNGIPTALAADEHCCGMPKLELGDLESVRRLKEKNVPELHRWVAEGWDLTAPVPSCVLMFKQELRLMFPDDPEVQAVAEAFFDPFEYLMARHRYGKLKTDFKTSLGRVAYQVPCHLRVQNMGLKTRDLLQLVPGTSVQAFERCSGHDGTYAVKKEFAETSRKIARPVARQVDAAKADHFISDCPMAAQQIAAVAESAEALGPLRLLRRAYGI
ncbi:MAG TPA: heterodisulfide reductase-related iron-sulfur binding cluster [Gammaproteobacteria bacterium]|nr:heterodisulfide reductase-related iron-sulfur binding cluster [Gammaproteobacteria bacterium]